MKIAFVFPGQGSQSVGMLDSFRDNAAVQSVVARASSALGQNIGALIDGGPAEELNLTDQHAARTADRRLCDLRRMARSRRCRAGDCCRAQPGRIHRAGSGGRTRTGRRGAVGSLSRASDAGSGAGRHGLDGCDSRSAGRPGAAGVQRSCARRNRRAGQLQRAVAGRDRRPFAQQCSARARSRSGSVPSVPCRFRYRLRFIHRCCSPRAIVCVSGSRRRR